MNQSRRTCIHVKYTKRFLVSSLSAKHHIYLDIPKESMIKIPRVRLAELCSLIHWWSDSVAESDSLWLFSINSQNQHGESLHRIRWGYFFQLSASSFISENHFTESAENHFSLKNAFGRQRAILHENLLRGALPNGPLIRLTHSSEPSQSLDACNYVQLKLGGKLLQSTILDSLYIATDHNRKRAELLTLVTWVKD
jgi:hypothetical protein